MKLAWPYFSYNDYLFEGLFRDLGLKNQLIRPAKPTKQMIEKGSFYAEEDACSPFKFVLGSFIDSLERGANHIVIGDGTGTCRFSLYGPVLKLTLENLGFDFTYHSFDYHKPQRFLKCFKDLSDGYNTLKVILTLRKSMHRNRLLDQVKKLLTRYRAMEVTRGTSDRVAEELWTKIMHTQNLSQIRALQKEIPKVFEKKVEIDESKEYLRFAIIGEIYVVSVEEANYGIERILNEMGVITDTNVSLRKFSDIAYKISPFKTLPQKAASKRAAKSWLKHYVGGCGQENVGSLLMFHEKGFDGAFHLAPLPCLPEISASYIIEHLSRELDFPVLPIFADEYEYSAGFLTRIESFVNSIKVWGKERKEQKPQTEEARRELQERILRKVNSSP
jgi:predicted nucleotide-binding protein (sugar kinase/HSP70/actin superfamily)